VQVRENLKGQSAEEVTIIGSGDFKCAKTKYGYGDYVLFLRKGEGFYKSANWQQGAIKIDGQSIIWFESENERFNKIETSLQEAKNQIIELIGGSRFEETN